MNTNALLLDYAPLNNLYRSDISGRNIVMSQKSTRSITHGNMPGYGRCVKNAADSALYSSDAVFSNTVVTVDMVARLDGTAPSHHEGTFSFSASYGSSTRGGFHMRRNSSPYYPGWWDSANSTWRQGATALTRDVPYHIVVLLDGAGKRVACYINAVLQFDVTQSNSFAGIFGCFNIGWSGADSGSEYMHGSIHRLRVWKGWATMTDIRQMYARVMKEKSTY